MLLGELLIKVHLTTRGHGCFKVTANLGVALFKIGDELEDAIFGLPGRLFLFVPVGNRPSQINSLNLLHERANDIILIVADWPYANKVDQDLSSDIFTSDSCVLLGELLVADARDYELILTRFATIYVIIGIKK